MATLYGGVVAQSSVCTTKLISMLACLDYINGNTLKPSEECCTQLAILVPSQPQCMCQFLNGDGSFIDQTRAFELPMTCNVEIPPTSQCNGNDINIYLATCH
ncbi:bifunctional inhibitor/lipid-transfer protein/seed storage 2S albumin superfamily protein [Artemisia annua]|uniref:Bifunctional inhibitor/lipid-transfer protein/seed storage 2S albumin superfamily protein n=1 Tax=Artemisia annua TaxID=35608 RepID=A0A2U1PPQ6_ARTAN|nr:bifunctional inhibitor/lipid-transfer protein/seed storage 2S albumin superfamily protein [Artemisia annua]